MGSLKAWVHGLVAAVIGGASSAGAAALAAPATFNFSRPGMITFSKIILVSGVLNAFAYLKQSPLPSETSTVTATVTKTVSTTPDH